MFKKSIILFLSILITSLLVFCGCYDYSNWHKVEIPTATEYKGTVKIPNDWEFIRENEIIFLVDTNTQETIAEQIYCEWRVSAKYGDGRIETNWDELNFNSNISLDVSNRDNYTFERGFSTAAYIERFNDGINERYCFTFRIYDTPDEGEYRLCLMFEEKIDLEVLKQIAESYEWGGYIENENDS